MASDFGGAIKNNATGIIKFNDLAIFKNNSAFESGGAIMNYGQVEFNGGVKFIGNILNSEEAMGGAIRNKGNNASLQFKGTSIFTNNRSTDSGAIESNDGTITFAENSINIFANNIAGVEYGSGGALSNFRGTLTFEENSNTIVIGNKVHSTSSYASGGGFYNSGTMNFKGSFLFSDNSSMHNNTLLDGQDIHNEKTINFEFGNNQIGILDSGIYQTRGTINKTGSGVLVIGDKTINSYGNTSYFNQNNGLTIAPVDKLNFAKINTITGGELRVHGDNLQNLKVSVSGSAQLSYLTTDTTEQLLEFSSDLTFDGATLLLGAYTPDEKQKELAFVSDIKIPLFDADGNVSFDTNGDILYGTYDAKNKLLTSDTIERATFNLKTDVANTDGINKVIFKDSLIKLGQSTYTGVYEIDSSNIVDLKNSKIDNISFSNLQGNGAKLGIDIDFMKESDGSISLKADKLALNGSNYEFSEVDINLSNSNLLNTYVDNLVLDQNGSFSSKISYTTSILNGNATFKNTSTNLLTATSPYTYRVTTLGKNLIFEANKLSDDITPLEYLISYDGNSTLKMVKNGTIATYSIDKMKTFEPLSSGNKLIIGTSSNAKNSSINANGNDLFILNKEDTNLTIKDLSILGAQKVIDNQLGHVTLQNIIISETTADTAITNNADITLKNITVDKNILNTGTIIGEGNISLSSLTGNGNLFFNNVTLDISDKISGTNNVVSNNMNIIGNAKKINFNNLDIQNGSLLDISNKNVFVNKIKFGEDSTLRVTLNSLEDYGTLSYDDIEGDENSKLNLKFTNGIKENGVVYKIFNSNNELILIENPLLDIIDMQDGSYSVSKKAAALLEEDLGLSNTEVNIVIALLNKPDDTTNKDFVNIQENLLNLLQSDDKRVFLTAKKALNALEGVDRSIYQSQITNLFNQLHIISSQMASNNISSKVGRSGGEETPRAKVYIKGLYDRTKSSMGEGFRARSKGAVLGVQSEVTDTLTLGVGYATSQTTAKEDLRRTEVDTNTGFISAYYQPNAWWVSGLATFSRGEYEEEKQILSSMGKASYDVDSWGAQVMTGYDIKLENAIITPEVGLRYLFVKQEGYTDTLGTTVVGTQSDYLTALVGVKGTWDMGAIRPTAGVTVGYDVISDDVSALNTLANGASYTVNGEALDRLSTGVSLGVEADLGERTTLKLEYSGTFRKEYVDHSGMLKLEMKF